MYIKLQHFSDTLQAVSAHKHTAVLERFKFDYGYTGGVLTLKRIKGTLFHINHIFGMNICRDKYTYRLTAEEIKEILNKLLAVSQE